MQAFYLYSTLGCHLCELAEAELMPFVALGEVTITVVDIAEDAAYPNPENIEEDLVAIYGTRIPVLHHRQTGLELNWPFARAELAAFFAAVSQA